MDSEGRIIEVVLGRPKNWCRQFARPRKVSVYDPLDRLTTASERTSSVKKLTGSDRNEDVQMGMRPHTKRPCEKR